MADKILRLKRRIKKLKTLTASGTDLTAFRDRPLDYIHQILGVQLTPDQEAAVKAVRTPPYRVLVPAANNVGKSFLAACLVCWRFDCVKPGVVLTTAPTERQVKEILWREVRKLRANARVPEARGGFPGANAPVLTSAWDCWAAGYTARDADRFQGIHARNTFVIFDEAEGVEVPFWEAAETMIGGDNYGFMAIYNPTGQGTPTTLAERSSNYTTVRISALNHPNIAKEQRGEAPDFPSAIRLGRLQEQLQEWSEPVAQGEEQPGDVLLAGTWYRPGPLAQSRLMGRRPDTAFNSVWSDWLVVQCIERDLPLRGPLQIGCDVARFGDDYTAIHVRIGGSSVHHESANGWSIVQTAARVKEVAYQMGLKYGVDGRGITIAVDDCGVGGGVVDVLAADRWRVVGINAAGESPDPEEYPNLRSALWFDMAAEATRGNVSFKRLPRAVQDDLRRELTAPLYKLDLRGRRVVESKDDTKERLRRSPDNADAVLLSFTNVSMADRVAGKIKVPV